MDKHNSTFDVAITTGIQELTMRIDANTDLFGQPAPLGVFGVTGIRGKETTIRRLSMDIRSPLKGNLTTEPVLADFCCFALERKRTC